MSDFNYKRIRPFKWFVLENFPFIEADFDAITNYQLFCKVVEYLNKTIDNTNILGKKVQEFSEYFENLDVQDEIDNKLDEMVEQGTLQEIIADYLNSKAIFGFDNVEEMKNATNLIDGSYAKTLGYYEKNDGGGSLYKIESNKIANNMNIIELNNDLFATLIEDSYYVQSKKYGVHCDKVTDDTLLLQNVIDYCEENDRELEINGYCYVTNSINTKGVYIKGIGKRPTPEHIYYSKTYGNIGWDYLRNVGNGALISFSDYVEDILNSGSGIISDIANPVLKCNTDDGKFKLDNISIVGWIRNENQVGIKSTYSSDSNEYIDGKHLFKEVSVFNFGNNGVELNSLELTELYNIDFSYNMGHGLYIEEVEDFDCPFEYTTFRECKIRGNKLDGIYAKNCFRKNVKFVDCLINRNGLYDQLNITPSDNIEEIVAGITIKGRTTHDSQPQTIIEFDNCHGEEQNLLIKIDTYGSGNITNDITIKNCNNYPSLNTQLNALAYVNTYFTRTMNYYNNHLQSNLPQLVTSSQTQKIIPNIVDYNFYTSYQTNPNITVSSKITVSKKVQYRYGNLIFINVIGTTNDTLNSYEDILTNLPIPIEQYHPNINIGGEIQRCAVYINGKFQAPVQISSGKEININLVYFEEYQKP